MTRQHWIAIIVMVVMIYATDPALIVSARERQYRRQLNAFSSALKPGMKRTDVDAYLRAQNVVFSQGCCTAAKRGAMDDLVAIAHQRPGLICEERNIYVALEFAAVDPGKTWVADSDRFVRADLFRSTCLDLP